MVASTKSEKIRQWLRKHPDANALDVADRFKCSTALVHMQRKKLRLDQAHVEEPKSSDPITSPGNFLTDRNGNGNGHGNNDLPPTPSAPWDIEDSSLSLNAIRTAYKFALACGGIDKASAALHALSSFQLRS